LHRWRAPPILSKLPPVHRLLSTADVAPAQRKAYWTDLACEAYVQLECEAPPGASTIEGSIEVDQLAAMALTRVTSTAQLVRRTPAMIARAAEDRFLVSIQTAGRGVISQDGRDAVLAPGDFALYDSTRPYTLSFDGPFQQFVLMMPGPMLRSALRDTRHLTATAVAGDRGAGRLLIEMIRTLSADIDTLAPPSAAAVADSVTQILVAGLSALPAARGPGVSTRAALHREQLKSLVRRRLRDPALNVAELARALRLTPSTLHRAWAGEPCSLSDWIWAQRLDAARRDLADPALARRGVSAVAFGCGFNDAAHFSRAFRTRFGCTPSEWRAASAAAGG
jgi:AraC-like DNA-binding protein